MASKSREHSMLGQEAISAPGWAKSMDLLAFVAVCECFLATKPWREIKEALSSSPHFRSSIAFLKFFTFEHWALKNRRFRRLFTNFRNLRNSAVCYISPCATYRLLACLLTTIGEEFCRFERLFMIRFSFQRFLSCPQVLSPTQDHTG